MRRPLFLSALLLAGCSQTPSELPLMSLDGDFSARAGLASGYLPIQIFHLFSGLHSCVRDSCPVVTELDDGWLYEGGCVDESGVAWSGVMEERGSADDGGHAIRYEGWGFSSEEGSLTVDGFQLMTQEGTELSLIADSLRVAASGTPLAVLDNRFPGEGKEALVEYLRHEMILDPRSGEWSVGASMSVDELGALSVEGSGWLEEGEEIRPFGGLTVTGEETAEFNLEGDLPALLREIPPR